MKKIAVISSVMIGVFLMSGIATVASAGVEPSPFQPEINRLGAITQGLASIEKRVVDVVCYPPDPVIPTDNGVINRLEAMVKQLQLLNGLLIAVMEEVLTDIMPPDPVLPADVVFALVGVGEAAQGIVDIFPPDPIIPFEMVKDAAQAIDDNVTYYLGLSDCGACSRYTDPGDCQEAGCIWVMPDDPDLQPYCCNP